MLWVFSIAIVVGHTLYYVTVAVFYRLVLLVQLC